MCKKDWRELNEYRSLGKPGELVMPVYCRECRHLEYDLPHVSVTSGCAMRIEYRCSISRLWMTPNDYCSRGRRE